MVENQNLWPFLAAHQTFMACTLNTNNTGGAAMKEVTIYKGSQLK